MAISHAGHNHPATPAARAACRKALAANPLALAGTSAFTPIDREIVRAQMNRDARRRMDRGPIVGELDLRNRIARQSVEKPARIQPRRSGARVSARNTSCVQAALHIDAHGGRCACGWEALAA